ncbi:MAG: hypothetical protein ABIF19_05675 [Planctomycetota bacterium]
MAKRKEPRVRKSWLTGMDEEAEKKAREEWLWIVDSSLARKRTNRRQAEPIDK